MSAIQRVRLAVDTDWRVTITLPDASTLPLRTLRREKVPGGVSRDVPAALPWPPAATATPATEVQLMADRFRRVAQRSPVSHEAKNDFDVVEVGRHLFETLLGDAVWSSILAATAGASMIELALEWSKDERELHRLNWEMMHGPGGFLGAGFNGANGQPVRVAISRVVTEASAFTRLPSELPRILFVVGCSLNDQRIRAGAELFGLLRQIKAKERGGTIVTQRYLPIRLLQEATPDRLAASMREFQPEIVHIISHGTAEPNAAPGLLLQPNPGQQGEQWKEAGQLLQLLTVDAPGEAAHGWRPSVVVLSACFSGTVGVSTVGGPSQGGPLAAQLVAGGIPVVIGMAGQVADQACRLFTRTFGEALVYGKPLVAAVEAGRRAAFTLGDWPRRSVDWALPTFYRGPGLAPEFCVTAPDRSADEQWLQNALGTLGLDRQREPTLAARFEVLDVHFERLQRAAPGALVVLGESGSGKSRLLREIAGQAVAQGDVPLLVAADDPPDHSRFKDQEAVRLTWMQAMARLCKGLRLAFPNPCQLRSVGEALAGGARGSLHPDVSLALDLAPKTLQPLLRALQVDLLALLAMARAAVPARHPAGARAWLLLDHLHLYAPELQPGFYDTNLTPFTKFGLSESAAEPLPVVLAFDPSDRAAQGLKSVAEGKCRSWMADITLDPFTPDGIDVLNYSRVLLNPHNPALYKSPMGDPISELPWVIDPDASDKAKKEWFGFLRHWLHRQPRDFTDEDLYRWVDLARRENFVRVADDEDKLRQFQP
jgi:hypothetical protein